MEQISNVATQAAYANALTLGPLNYEAISVNVWNNSCVSQVYELGNGGDYQTGNWGAESLEAANSTFTLGRCGGVRFRDNPDTPGVHARIVAYAWQAGNVQKVGGIQLAGILGSTGNVTTSAMTTGIVASNGTITAGTGFTVNRTGTGVYVVSYTTAFSATPLVVVSDSQPGSSTAALIIDAQSASGFTLKAFNSSTAAALDQGFNFLASSVV